MNRGLPPGTAASPVVGSENDNVPTSGDVHLYSDPGTYHSTEPVLYADCEGLEGWENAPIAVRPCTTETEKGRAGKAQGTSDFTQGHCMGKYTRNRKKGIRCNGALP